MPFPTDGRLKILADKKIYGTFDAGRDRRVDRALAGIESMLKQYPALPKGKWYFESGRLLSLANREPEAKTYYQKALQWLDDLPKHRQSSARILQLRENVHAKLIQTH